MSILIDTLDRKGLIKHDSTDGVIPWGMFESFNAGGHNWPKAILCTSKCRKRQHKLLCQSFLQIAGAGLPTVSSGWILAGSILAAVRLARKQAEDDRMHKLQV